MDWVFTGATSGILAGESRRPGRPAQKRRL